MKFLSASFREAMAEFFGKAGMPWHGAMMIRRTHGDEAAADGEYVVSYIDAMMSDKKEDGFATLSAVYLALEAYKADNPWITQAAVKTDGAGAYAGIVFTTGLSMMGELTKIRVTDHYIGESGKGKSQLDGHFGVKGAQLRRLVAAALHDIITPEKLYEGVTKTLNRNESAQLFQPDRSGGSSLDAQSVKQLSAMSHRHFEYERDGTFAALVLRQQTNLGAGMKVDALKLRKPGATAFAFAAPKLLGQSGATNASMVDADGTHVPAATAAAAPKGSTAPTLPIARSKKGRDQAEGLVARRRATREEKAAQAAKAERALFQARCQQSQCFWCSCDPDGHLTCIERFATPAQLKAHILRGKHTEGSIRPFRSGVAAGRGSARDRDISMVANALEAVVATSSVTAAEQPALLVLAANFSLIFADGDEYVCEVAAAGWARAQRLPAERCSVAQLEFVWHAYTVGKTFKQVKLSAASAHDLMRVVGTAAPAAQWQGHEYLGVDLNKPRFGRNEVLDIPRLKGYFGKPEAYLKKLFENAKAKGEVEEEEEEEDDDDDGVERPKKKRRRKKADGGGAGGEAGGGAGGEGSGGRGGVTVVGSVMESTLISSLTPSLVKGFGPKKVEVYEAAQKAAAASEAPLPTTCGELARTAVLTLVAAKIAGIGQKTWEALVAALAAHFDRAAAGAGAAGGGAGSGDAGGGSGGDGSGGDGDGDDDEASGGGASSGITGDSMLATMTLPMLPRFTDSTHGFSGKLAKCAAAWPTCAELASADVRGSRPSGVGLTWALHLQQAVRAELPRPADSDDEMDDDDADGDVVVDDGRDADPVEPTVAMEDATATVVTSSRQRSGPQAAGAEPVAIADRRPLGSDGGGGKGGGGEGGGGDGGVGCGGGGEEDEEDEDGAEEDDDDALESDDDSELGSAAGTDDGDDSDDDEDDGAAHSRVGEARRR